MFQVAGLQYKKFMAFPWILTVTWPMDTVGRSSLLTLLLQSHTKHVIYMSSCSCVLRPYVLGCQTHTNICKFLICLANINTCPAPHHTCTSCQMQSWSACCTLSTHDAAVCSRCPPSTAGQCGVSSHTVWTLRPLVPLWVLWLHVCAGGSVSARRHLWHLPDEHAHLSALWAVQLVHTSLQTHLHASR